MTTILVKGNTQVKFLITKEKAEKCVSAGGNTNTSIQALTPLEANREMNELLRKGYKVKNAKAGRV